MFSIIKMKLYAGVLAW